MVKKMIASNTLKLTVASVVLLFGSNLWASDLAKEKRWADQVVDAIIDGEAVWLNDGKSDFLSIYTEADESNGKAVIVMHGTGIHPNWSQVVQPLRVGLIESGWNTLSIQMPILANEAEYAEYAPLYAEVPPRIDAAVAYLKEQGMKTIVLVGHSQGAAMAAYYLSITDTPIDGFVAIGMASLDTSKAMNSFISLEQIKQPVFDLYGEEDLENIIANASGRVAAAKKAGNKKYTQTRIPGNHFFDGQEDILVETVSGWLSENY
jgi:predicted esterase